MNIAIFTNNYLPNPYGVTTSIESFRIELEKLGHRVYIFAPGYEGYRDKNKHVFRYPSVDMNYKIRFPLPIPYSRRISKKIEKLKIDIIHSQHPNLLGSVAWCWAKKKNIPIVFTWHTVYDKYTHYTPLLPQKFATNWIIKNSVKYANKVDKVIVPTQSVKEIIGRWGFKNEDIEIIPTGVDEDNFKGADGNNLRDSLGIEKEKKIILSISRLTEEKNVIFLVREVIVVLKNNPNTVFVLGGDGYLKSELVKIINESGVGEQVFFSGLIERTEVKNYMEMADIFVYASKSETQGTIITEAMYMGLPIVAMDSSGVSDLIENNKTGILVYDKKDVFSDKIEEILLDQERLKFLGESAYEEARKKYTAKVCSLKMLGIYAELIKKFKECNKVLD